jgi:hypothetical protein
MDSEGRNPAWSVADAAGAPPPSESPRPKTAPPPPPPSSPSPDEDRRSTEEVISDLHLRFRELVDYVVYFLMTRIDAARHYVKQKILWLSLIALGVLAGAGAVVTAVVLLCTGIADGLSALFGRVWAGELATGVILLGVTGLLGSYMFGRLVKQSHQERVAKYDAFRARFRERYGHDIDDPAGPQRPGGRQ